MISALCQALGFNRSYLGPAPEAFARLMCEAAIMIGRTIELNAHDVLAWEDETGDSLPSYFCPYFMVVRWRNEELFWEWARREMPMEIFKDLDGDNTGIVGEKLVLDLLNFLLDDLVRQAWGELP